MKNVSHEKRVNAKSISQTPRAERKRADGNPASFRGTPEIVPKYSVKKSR